VFVENSNRNVVPRWRDFVTTSALGELTSTKSSDPLSHEDFEALSQRASEWENNQTIWHAADLLSSAFVVGEVDPRASAVQYILNNRDKAPLPLVRLAQSIANPAEEQTVEEICLVQEDEIYRGIHATRTRLRDEPRNAIQWVELSRLYTLLGDSRHATESMRVAATLGPDNRFVVRSAARLFLHERDPIKALRVIRNASGAKTDPWLLAAEISVSSAAKLPSLLAKTGQSRNDDDAVPPFARAELSSALATLELAHGKQRKARQLFRKALEAPNENSVAQVEWASQKLGGLEVTESALMVPRSFEATARRHQINGEWASAIRQGTMWLSDQPFSKRAAIFTSYVSSLIEQYSKSAKILRKSLKLNPGDFTLINNLAFALASDNKVNEAAEVLNGTDYTQASGTGAITLAATQGLLLFRMGFPAKGREMYRLAVRKAQQLGNQSYTLRAHLYLAREEMLAQTPTARSVSEEALSAAIKSDSKDVLAVAEQVLGLFKRTFEESDKRVEGSL
jgi:tetratricopeptide (TPR) repeat protein